MKSGKLAEIVESISALAQWAQGERAVDLLNRLFIVLAKNPKQDLITVFALSVDGQASPDEGELTLKKLLDSVLRIQKASGAAPAAKSVAHLNDNLPNDISLEQAISNVESFDLVSNFVRQLNDSAGSRDRFERVMSLFEAKGAVSKAQACVIAQKYAGGAKPKSFDQAVSAIRSKFSADQLFASKTG